MAALLLLALLLLPKRLQAGSVLSSRTDRPCTTFLLPVPAAAENAEYDTIPVGDNINATAWSVDVDTWSFNETSRIIRNFTVSDIFQINAQLCVPSRGFKKDKLIIATHGGLFDKRYWDPAINPSEYSFVNAAITAGYSILTYDRLGTGLSDKPDAYTIVQASLQLDILRSLTLMARSGELMKHAAGIPTPNVLKDVNQSFTKIIHVGHSFGSVLTNGLITTYPNTSDAAILTGYILNQYFGDMRKTAFDFEYAPQSDPALFGDRSSGYMVDGSLGGFQTIFFNTLTNGTTGIGGFAKEVLDYAFSIRQTITTSELMSPRIKVGAAPEFKGPVQHVLAELDFPVCRGDCKLPYDLEKLYPSAIDRNIQMQYGNGHALTMHIKASLGYQATFEWLDRSGL